MPSQHNRHDNIREALMSFEPLGLSDLGVSALMNRVDTKFMLSVQEVPQLLHALQPLFGVLQINQEVLFDYSSTYLDTPDFHLYRSHHVGRPKRTKVRVRDYMSTGTSFLEVKSKNIYRETTKHRVSLPFYKPFTASNHAEGLKLGMRGIADILDAQFNLPYRHDLKPTLRVNYRRLTLVSVERTERLTIDLDVQMQALRDLGLDATTTLNSVALLELKQQRLNKQSPAYECIRQFQAHSMGFSKYCMGVALLSDGVLWPRFNSFKPRLRQMAQRFEVFSQR